MTKPPKADYCIEIQFEKGTEDPARVFRSMQALIETFQEFDQSLVKSIDSNIKPILILEDIDEYWCQILNCEEYWCQILNCE